MRRLSEIGLTDNVSNPDTLPAAPSAESFKTHIERLAYLIGRGVAMPSTIPPEEIEQAQAFLLQIGIAMPKEARTTGNPKSVHSLAVLQTFGEPARLSPDGGVRGVEIVDPGLRTLDKRSWE